MGWLGKLMGTAPAGMVGEAAGGFIGEAISAAAKIKTLITGKLSPEAELEVNKLLEEHNFQLQQSQAEINKVQAAHPSVFVAGARPAAILVCVFGLAFQTMLYPLMNWIALIAGADFAPPVLDTDTLIGLLVGLLGLGVYRTYEKSKAVQGNH